MIDATIGVSLSAALIAGLAGSAHCFVMCGGLAGALGLRARVSSASPMASVWHPLLYQLGRIGGYASIGAVGGLVGSGLQSLLDLVRVGLAVRIASGALLILIAVKLLWRWNVLGRIERWGARLWSTLQPAARRAAGGSSPFSTLGLGLLWGWMPCGLVYSMLMFAVLSGDALRGAAIMTVFGFGTLPSMLASSWLAPRLTRIFGAQRLRAVSGALLLLFGVWMIAATLASGLDTNHSAHGDHAAHVH